jgi:hypothetical protein
MITDGAVAAWRYEFDRTAEPQGSLAHAGLGKMPDPAPPTLPRLTLLGRVDPYVVRVAGVTVGGTGDVSGV